MELRCGACGKVGKYKVGRLMLDPITAREGGPENIDKAWGFSGYFHCKRCGAGAPWELTARSRILLLALMMEAIRDPEHARIHFLRTVLFDGTICRWPTLSEAHLKGLIEKEPGNYFLWSRLGNVYKAGEAYDLAVPAFQKAVELNEHDVESLHSLAEIHLDRDEAEKAAEYYHQMLLQARHAPERTRPELLREMVDDALDQLLQIHLDSGKRIPFLPIPPEVRSLDQADPGVRLLNFDLSDQADRGRLIDWWITGKPPTGPVARKAKQPPPAPLPRALRGDPLGGSPGRVGRNDPCPCGSGRKFKNCCLRS
jgi:hypothetical protein